MSNGLVDALGAEIHRSGFFLHVAEGDGTEDGDGEPHGAVIHLATHVANIEGVTGIQKLTVF